ncbi:MAG TPA: YIP1 family protein [Gemmatimonadales bacterium]|jgi:hypothetical protein
MTEPTTAAIETPGPIDVAEVLYAPSAVFARRRDGAFGLPLLIIVVLGAAVTLATMNLIEPAMHADTMRGMQPAIAAGKLTADQAAASAGTFAKFAPFGLIFFYLVAPFVVGLVTWVAGLITRVRVGLGVGVMIATFSLVPRILGGIAAAIIAVLRPDGSLTSMTKVSVSVAQFVDPAAHAGLAAVLARTDLFALWSYVLIGIGVRVITGCTRLQAGATAFIVWLVFTLWPLWLLATRG